MKKLTTQIVLTLAACFLALSLPLYTIFLIYPHFTQIITFEKEVNAKQIATHITKMLVLDRAATTLTRANITTNFTAILEEARLDFDLTKIKVFSSGGEILYSTQAQDIGIVNTNPYFTDIVAKGKMFSKIVPKNEKSMEGKTVTRNVVETYVPLMRDQHFIGAFEIYYDISYTEHSLGRFIEKSRLIVLLLSLLLLLVILSIALSAMSNLSKLRRTENKLQRLKDQIPPLYSLPPDEMDT